MNLHRFCVALLLACFCVGASAQQKPKSQPLTPNQLAMQYYRNGDYQKAGDIFSQLFNQTGSDVYYSYLYSCLIHTSNYSEAEVLVNKQLKATKQNPKYVIDLGYVYSKTKREEKAEKLYNQLIKKIEADASQITTLANGFINKGLYQYAEQVYIEGRKVSTYPFHTELAQVYMYQRNYSKMIDEYLEQLRVSDDFLQNVQNHLQAAVYNDIDNSLVDLLKSKLLKYTQIYPDRTVFAELLVWLMVQQGEYEMALFQVKALDRRLEEGGRRVVELARQATTGNDFNTAIAAYQYAIENCRNREFMFAARSEMLQVMFTRIELELDNSIADYERLEEAITTALAEEGISADNIDMVRNLAKLKAFYLNKTADAQFLLEDIKDRRDIAKTDRGEIEIELADVYLMQDRMFDATIAYTHVADANPNNDVGAEAKFRKAKLAYYIGDFGWAQTQLNALKASTEKFIANDAAALSLLIEENTGWGDSTEHAMQLYAAADLLHYQHQNTKALATLDSLITLYPEDALNDEALYLKAQIIMIQGDTANAKSLFETISQKWQYEILTDNALMQIAKIEEQNNNTQAAMNIYLRIMSEYESSIFVREARSRFRKLREN